MPAEQSLSQAGFYSGLTELPAFSILSAIPRVSLGRWPTPLEQVRNKPEIAIKRDDLSGYGRGGLKTRKLETVFAFLLKKKYTDVVLVVPNVSNLRADIELFSRSHPVRFHLIVANDPYIPEQRRVYPADTDTIVYYAAGASAWFTGWMLIRKYVQLRLQGKKVLGFLPGIAHPAAVAGAAQGMIELAAQYRKNNTPGPAHIFVSAASGSGAAGLMLGAALLKQQGLTDMTIHAVRVFPLPMKLWIALLVYWTRWKFKLHVPVDFSRLRIHQAANRLAYGETHPELEGLCKAVEEESGIRIDPIYGARSWLAMSAFLSEHPQPASVLFWHCGYTPDWKMFNQRL